MRNIKISITISQFYFRILWTTTKQLQWIYPDLIGSFTSIKKVIQIRISCAITKQGSVFDKHGTSNCTHLYLNSPDCDTSQHVHDVARPHYYTIRLQKMYMCSCINPSILWEAFVYFWKRLMECRCQFQQHVFIIDCIYYKTRSIPNSCARQFDIQMF